MTTEDYAVENLGSSVEEKGRELLQRADAALRENPVPTIITALALGFGIGLLVRVLQPERSFLHECLEETSDSVRTALKPLRKKARRAYAASSGAVHDAIEEAVDRLHDVDVEPVAKWWKRLWS